VLFNTLGFFAFLAVVLVVFYVLPERARRWWLLGASYYFYGSWNVKFLALLVGVTAVDYTAGLLIARQEGRARRWVLVGSLAMNLGVLVFFKYFHFLCEVVLGHRLGIEIVLPIGISFHIFQSISYVIDVYRGEQEPVRNPLDYALFLAFFPQLVAGPIVRARDFFRDLEPWVRPGSEDVARGVLLLVLGLTKKMAFADPFAKLSDAYFGSLAGRDGILDAWAGTMAFGLQIFFDFSGYTDMAIGMAKLMGFHFPVNFRRPYLAGSMSEFWRRWHISLSTWLRDYLYIPLGGNRKGEARTYVNLMLTMLLGGLWHGASWNFVIWGGWHGAWLAVERALGMERARWWRVPLVLLVVLHGWVFFRAQTLGDAVFVVEHLWRGTLGVWGWKTWHWGLLCVAAVVAVAEEKWGVEERLVRGGVVGYALAVAAMLLVLAVFGVTDVEIPFVYFQF
jgi:alginate O-acetyltransferase complex protein AlgI